VRELGVDLGEDRSYKILIGAGILGEAGTLLQQNINSSKVLLVSNPLVYSLYGEQTVQSLQSAGMEVSTVLMPDGEEYKNIEETMKILDKAVEIGLERSSLILALGGGVVGDLAGFAASIYQRGIPCIQVPTTLLSQVDSSVGGKTAVNHRQGKNMIGTFHQPSLVIIDTMTLSTLAEREYLAGLGEVVKYGLIYDKDFFTLLEKNAEKLKVRDQSAVREIIYRCVQIKSEIVSADEKECGLRMILNLGHTFGHSLEKLGDYRELKHGEAVASGTLAASLLACRIGLLGKKELSRIELLFQKFGISAYFPPYPPQDIYDGMLNDKKVKDNKLRLVVPRGIGGYKIINDPEQHLILDIIQDLIR